MARPKKRYTKMSKGANNSFEKMFNDSIKRLKANEKDIENALKKFLDNDELKVTEAEYNEIKKLTDTLEEIDRTIEEL